VRLFPDGGKPFSLPHVDPTSSSQRDLTHVRYQETGAAMVGLKVPQPERSRIGDIPVEVRRTRRRRTRIGLAFDPGGFVIVEAPLDASKQEIRALIREHERWLRHRLAKVADSNAISAGLRYVDGELMHYLGQRYELVAEAGPSVKVRLAPRPDCAGGQLNLFALPPLRGQLRVALPRTDSGVPLALDPRLRDAVLGWYQRRADEVFGRVLESWSEQLPWLRGQVPAWRHRFMRSQWGSCNRQGRISLNTHLVKTPVRLIEYVVLHELCHLRHYDHGRGFYALMARHMPNWEQRRRELDRYLPVLLQE